MRIILTDFAEEIFGKKSKTKSKKGLYYVLGIPVRPNTHPAAGGHPDTSEGDAGTCRDGTADVRVSTKDKKPGNKTAGKPGGQRNGQ